MGFFINGITRQTELTAGVILYIFISKMKTLCHLRALAPNENNYRKILCRESK